MKWINVEKKLPDDGKRKLVCVARIDGYIESVGTARFVTRYFNSQEWVTDDGYSVEPTHWMDLPDIHE